LERTPSCSASHIWLVRLLHLILSAMVGRNDPDRLDALLRFAPTAVIGASLLVLAGFLDGNDRIAVWVLALAIDYLGPTVIGLGRGWRIAPDHFAERHGLILLIALGESIIAIGVGVGVGAGLELGAGVLAGAGLGLVVVSALWWLYFDVAALIARGRLVEARGIDQARLARDAYGYLHLPLVAGIVLFAFGLEETLGHVGATLDTVPAVALCGGAALYLPRAYRVPVPSHRLPVPAADDRRSGAAGARSGRTRRARARSARAGERRLLPGGGLRGASLSRGSPPPQASRAGVTARLLSRRRRAAPPAGGFARSIEGDFVPLELPLRRGAERYAAGRDAWARGVGSRPRQLQLDITLVPVYGLMLLLRVAGGAAQRRSRRHGQWRDSFGRGARNSRVPSPAPTDALAPS
jgi:hypothetical protein